MRRVPFEEITHVPASFQFDVGIAFEHDPDCGARQLERSGEVYCASYRSDESLRHESYCREQKILDTLCVGRPETVSID